MRTTIRQQVANPCTDFQSSLVAFIALATLDYPSAMPLDKDFDINEVWEISSLSTNYSKHVSSAN